MFAMFRLKTERDLRAIISHLGSHECASLSISAEPVAKIMWIQTEMVNVTNYLKLGRKAKLSRSGQFFP